MGSVQEIILLFTKYPVPGQSKTRLIPHLGPHGAADLQRKMTTLIVKRVEEYLQQKHCLLKIVHEGGSIGLMRQWLGSSFSYSRQCDGELGVKMASAIRQYLGKFKSIILIGADCPSIDAAIFRDAFSTLKTHRVVLGPAFDGGYYLIGVQGGVAPEHVDHLFHGIDWGENGVLQQTLTRINEANLNYATVKQLHDIDTPEDLRYFPDHPHLQ